MENFVTTETENRTNIIKNSGRFTHYADLIKSTLESATNVHLHWISTDPMELKDWCILLDDFGTVMNNPQQWLGKGVLNANLRKIIASTEELSGVRKLRKVERISFIKNPYQKGNSLDGYIEEIYISLEKFIELGGKPSLSLNLYAIDELSVIGYYSYCRYAGMDKNTNAHLGSNNTYKSMPIVSAMVFLKVKTQIKVLEVINE